MTTTDITFIQHKRQTYIDRAAHKLFEVVISSTVALTPSSTYDLRVDWNPHPGKLDTMVFNRTIDLFKEVNVDAIFARVDEHSICVVLNAETVSKEHVRKPFFWSRTPGKFVNKLTGQPVTLETTQAIGPLFTGTVREWYETLVETVIDCSTDMWTSLAMTHSPDAIHVGRATLSLLEASVMYRPTFDEHDTRKGKLSNIFNVFVSDDIPEDEIRISTVINGTRYVGIVKVLDRNQG